MGKAVAIFLGLAMIAHIIRPFGLPGLKKRSDAWKIAIIALFAMVILVGIRPD